MTDDGTVWCIHSVIEDHWFMCYDSYVFHIDELSCIAVDAIVLSSNDR